MGSGCDARWSAGAPSGPWASSASRGCSRERRSGPMCGEGARQELERLEDPRDGLSLLEEKEYERCVLGRLMELIRGEFQETTWEAFRRGTLQQQPAVEVARDLGLTV